MSSIIHLIATAGRPTTVCCGVVPLELPRTDRITLNPQIYTCRGARA